MRIHMQLYAIICICQHVSVECIQIITVDSSDQQIGATVRRGGVEFPHGRTETSATVHRRQIHPLPH